LIDLADSPGVFARSLEAACASNRFRNPSLPPGECAGKVEERALGLEEHLRSSLSAAFDRAHLTASERERVIAKVVAWSCAPDTDLAGLQSEVDTMLRAFEAAGEERQEIVTGIPRVIAGNQSRDAA
jgi:hypothetical protein